MIKKKLNHLEWLEFELLSSFPNIRQAIYTKNSIPTSEQISTHLGIKKLLNPTQKHGTHITSFPNLSADFKINCDGIATQEKEVGLQIQHADCQATIFFDPTINCIANVHCGWRGNTQLIYTKTIDFLKKTYGCKPENLIVCISPSLGPDHAQFVNLKQEFPESFWAKSINHDYLNLWEISKNELLRNGVQLGNIEIAQLCTFANPELFFSYRRDKDSKRNLTVVALTS